MFNNWEYENMSRLPKQAEYYQFVQWCATPSAVRMEMGMPTNQKELASVLRVSEVILSRWKNEEAFREDIKREIYRWTRPLTPDVIYAFFRKIQKEGKGSDVKFWMQLVEDYQEHELVNNNPIEKEIKRNPFLDEEGNFVCSKQTWDFLNAKEAVS